MNAPLRHRPVLDIPRALPPAALRALDAIAADLRHLPRDCIVDRAELLHWLNRLARRVDGVKGMRVPMEPQPAKRAPAGLTVPAIKLVDAVFGQPAKARRPRSRTITSRKGKQVGVEVGRQFDLPLVIPIQPRDAGRRSCATPNPDYQP